MGPYFLKPSPSSNVSLSSVMLLLFFSFMWSFMLLKRDPCPDFRGSEINPTKASSPYWCPLFPKGIRALCPLLKPLPTLETGRGFLRRGTGEFALGGMVPLLKITVKIHYLFASKSQSHLLLLKLGKAQSFHPFSLISFFSEKIRGKSSLHFFFSLVWSSALFSMKGWKNILKIEKKRK